MRIAGADLNQTARFISKLQRARSVRGPRLACRRYHLGREVFLAELRHGLHHHGQADRRRQEDAQAEGMGPEFGVRDAQQPHIGTDECACRARAMPFVWPPGKRARVMSRSIPSGRFRASHARQAIREGVDLVTAGAQGRGERLQNAGSSCAEKMCVPRCSLIFGHAAWN